MTHWSRNRPLMDIAIYPYLPDIVQQPFQRICSANLQQKPVVSSLRESFVPVIPKIDLIGLHVNLKMKGTQHKILPQKVWTVVVLGKNEAQHSQNQRIYLFVGMVQPMERWYLRRNSLSQAMVCRLCPSVRPKLQTSFLEWLQRRFWLPLTMFSLHIYCSCMETHSQCL